jgi:UDP-N-acetylmuramoylalanine--D-glutamate ligase
MVYSDLSVMSMRSINVLACNEMEQKLKVIVGAGNTGLSVASYFRQQNIPYMVMDHNPAPAGLAALREMDNEVKFSAIDVEQLLQAEEVILSPGVPLASPELQQVRDAGIEIRGDIALFGEVVEAPVVAITGTNGKSTVTTLVGQMAIDQGIHAGVGGNLGIPCMDLVRDRETELFVLELSSYQLESAAAFKCDVGVVLNLLPDHLDRYSSVDAYFGTKADLYRRSRLAVVNRDIDYPFDISGAQRVITFGLGPGAGMDDFGLQNGGLYQSDQCLITSGELLVKGIHNQLNVLAGLAIGTMLGWDREKMLTSARAFSGLPHRCEWVNSIDGAVFINDSKSTNPTSTLAAIEGFAEAGQNMILILGGQGKGADFSSLLPAIEAHVTTVFVYGADRKTIAAQLPCAQVQTLETLEAVFERLQLTGDTLVLFSPGCASFDQFRNFEDRGEQFRSMVGSRVI